MHRPTTDDEFVQSLMLSDHFLDADARKRAAAQIRSGVPLEIDPDLRAQALASIQSDPGVRSWLEMANRPREQFPGAVEVAREFWRLMNTNDFASVAAVLSDSFVLEWPQSRERIRGAARFARMNAEYPAAGPWSFTLNRIVGGDQAAVTLVTVTDGKTTAQPISFFNVQRGKIIKLVEYWPEPYPAPAHRAHLVEPID
jgi:hypothetical protein